MKILICGVGSIGERHINNLLSLGHTDIILYRTSNSELRTLSGDFEVYDSLDEALSQKPAIAFITNPTSLHISTAIKCASAGCNLFVEKPLSHNIKNVDTLNEMVIKKDLVCMTGFMYRYHPQIQSVIKIIKDNKIGNLLSMESSFGEDILTKKKFFFFIKKKTIDPKSRKFDKNLGGGCILDLGCYPSSFSLLIASLKNKLNMNSLEILNVIVEKGETGVDIDSKAELSFQDGFRSKIHASFKKNLGSKTLIYGEKGTILLDKSWSGGDIIIHSKTNSEQKLNFANNKNIYGYQIEEISKNLIQGLNKINFPIMSLEETLLNMKIINDWLDYCEK